MSKDYDIEKEFLAGMAAKREGNYLIWNEEDKWIYVSDLPQYLIDEMMKQSCEMATIICQSYLGDFDDETYVNEGHA